MKKWIPVLLLSCFALVTNVSASAYVGASAMSTDAEIETAANTFDTDDFAWKVYGGFTFIKFFALEASYRDLGTQEETVGMNTVNVDLDAFDVSVRGILPFGDHFHIFARAGYAYISADGTFDLSGTVSNFDESDWEFTYGVGLDFVFGDHIGIRAEWEEYDVDDNLNSLSAGVFFQF